MTPYWCCALLDGRRQALALHCLGLAGYTTYQPRLALPRGASTPLFPRYTFIAIVCGWWEARWAPGVIRLLQSGGDGPAHVPDHVISELRSRERNGLIVLPPPPSPHSRQFVPGDRVRLTAGPLRGLSGLVEGMRPHERVAVLLELLGSTRPIELAAVDVERVEPG